MTSTDIIKRLKLVHKLKNRKKTILIEGNWGIGKTYSYREFIKNNNLNDIYISLFNILDVSEIDKKIIIKYFLKNNNKIIENIKNKTENIFNKLQNKVNKKVKADNLINKLLNNFTGINLNNFFEIIDINTLDFDKNTVICFDDLERINDNINFKNILGKIEQLHNKVTIVIICNTEKLSEENKKIFDEYKEKIIDNIYQMSELDSNFITDFIKESNLKTESQEFLINFFLENGKNNLRYLQKIKDNYEELKLTCENAEWFFDYEKDILEGIACLEAENCFQTYSKKNLENLKKIEEHFKEPNSRQQPRTEEELKKEVDFLMEFSSYVSKIIKILYSYEIKNINIKVELEKFFKKQEKYEKFYQLCDLYFLKGENEIIESYKKLKTLYNEEFEELNYKYKFYGFIVLNRYLKDLKTRMLYQNDSLNLEKEKLKKYIKNQLKQGLRVDYLRKIQPYLNDFDKEEFNILKNLKKEIDIEVDKEIDQEILDSIKNKNFDIIDKYYAGEFKFSYTDNEEIKNFFNTLLFNNSCPEEYWNCYKEIFSMLDKDSKNVIVQIIEKNIQNQNNYILKIRNQLIKKDLGYKNF